MKILEYKFADKDFKYGKYFFSWKKCDLHPSSITKMVNIFSQSVVGDTFPNPTDVKLLNVK